MKKLKNESKTERKKERKEKGERRRRKFKSILIKKQRLKFLNKYLGEVGKASALSSVTLVTYERGNLSAELSALEVTIFRSLSLSLFRWKKGF
jgi:hypothetical protein